MKETVSFCSKWIKKIEEENQTLRDDQDEAVKFYRNESDIVKTIKGQSKAVTTDLMDAVESAKPLLLEYFTSSEDAASIQPASGEDVENITRLHKLVNYQLKVKNSWFMLCHDLIDDALKVKFAVFKWQWFKDEKKINKDYSKLTDVEVEALLNDPTVTNIVEQSLDEDTLTANLTLEHTYTDEYPLIEVIPTDEFGMHYSTRRIEEAPFVFHKIPIQKYDIIRDYGKEKYDKIKALMEDKSSERLKDLGGKEFAYNEKEELYYKYECYYKDDETGECMITVLCGDEELSTEKNEYGRPPFRIATPIKIAHRAIGYGLHDLLKEHQKTRTVLLRQILNSVYFSNNPRVFGDPSRINMRDYLENNHPHAFIRTKGNPLEAVMPEPKVPLPSEVFSLWELLNTERDFHSVTPRSFQGTNPKVLNKTWRGQAQQVSQAGQRLGLVGRLIAEMAIAPLVKDVIELNLKFLKKEYSFRYLNENISVNPDNIVGSYDIIINVGTGTDNKDMIIGYMQQLLGLFSQVHQAGIPVVNAQNVYNTLKELILAIGKKNYQDFISDPEFNQSIMQLVQIVIQSGIAQQNPMIGQLIMKIQAMLGGGKQPNPATNVQNTPPPPEQPENPMPFSATPMGGEYFG